MMAGPAGVVTVLSLLLPSSELGSDRGGGDVGREPSPATAAANVCPGKTVAKKSRTGPGIGVPFSLNWRRAVSSARWSVFSVGVEVAIVDVLWQCPTVSGQSSGRIVM
jgi:hypothetical protein